ncbi:hypothetical protein GBAR_LOCUS6171 [Geodia barretti]|uniref:Uncharacterized protein n=1 Tax=Geodia barretti TaxID=519541 RepID=A0AA35RDB4_GEOBA|nr:hypothetical protein GBAR_LOCUS6171 [Geodia barretti]
MVDLSWFRRRQQAGLRPYDKPARERHIVSVVCSCLCVLLLILSLSLQEWGKAETSNCKFTFKLTQVVIEDKAFNHDYSFSSKSMKYASKQATLPLPAVTEYYSNSQQILISCVISVSALAIISSLISATISAGYPRERLEFLRHYSVFNIISLLCIVLVAGLWLGVAQFLPTDKQIMTCGRAKDWDREPVLVCLLPVPGGRTVLSRGSRIQPPLCTDSCREKTLSEIKIQEAAVPEKQTGQTSSAAAAGQPSGLQSG